MPEKVLFSEEEFWEQVNAEYPEDTRFEVKELEVKTRLALQRIMQRSEVISMFRMGDMYAKICRIEAMVEVLGGYPIPKE